MKLETHVNFIRNTWVSPLPYDESHYRLERYSEAYPEKPRLLTGFIFQKILRPLQEEFLQTALKTRQISDIPTRVIDISGLTGVGKTRFRRLISDYLTEWVETFKWLEDKDPIRGETPLKVVTYEKDGEESARKKGLIYTPSHMPFNDGELYNSDRMLSGNLAAAIKSSFITITEIPAISRIPLRKIHEFLDDSIYNWNWYGRTLGTNTFFKLAAHMEEFRDLNYLPYFVLLMGGPVLRNIMVYGRDAYNKSSSLEEAQEVAEIYGFPVPKNEDEWRNTSEGASVKQIEVVENTAVELVDRLEYEHLVDVSRKELYAGPFMEHAYPASFKNVLTKDELERDYKRWRFGLIILHVMNKLNPLGIDRQDVFAGYNSPTLAELNIKDLNRLIEDLRRRKSI